MDKICHYIDFNITIMQIKCKKYAKNMLNMQSKYAKKNMQKNLQKNMQNMHKSMYCHSIGIFCKYMHSPLC